VIDAKAPLSAYLESLEAETVIHTSQCDWLKEFTPDSLSLEKSDFFTVYW
jgi:hypothetical protein